MSEKAAKPVTEEDIRGLTAFALVWRLQLNVPQAAGPIKLRKPRLNKRPLRLLSANARLTSSRTVGSRAVAVIEGCLEFCVFPRPSNLMLGETRDVEDTGHALARAIAFELRSTRVSKSGPYNDELCREGFSQLLAPITDDDTRQFAFFYDVTVVNLEAQSLQFPGISQPIPLRGDSCFQLEGFFAGVNVCISLPMSPADPSVTLPDFYDLTESTGVTYETLYDSRQHALSVAHLYYLDEWLAKLSLAEKVYRDSILEDPNMADGANPDGPKLRRFPYDATHAAPLPKTP
jgi:hypothetical protein